MWPNMRLQIFLLYSACVIVSGRTFTIEVDEADFETDENQFLFENENGSKSADAKDKTGFIDQGSPLLSTSKQVFQSIEDKSAEVRHRTQSLFRNLFKTLNSTAASCPCKTLLLSSLGPASQKQSATLGLYSYYQEYNGKPVYYGPTNLHSSNRLFFSTQYNLWMLGDKLGSNAGFIYSANPSQCPYLIPDGWQYFDGNTHQWYYDTTLVLRCIPA
ncbi:uncharacterized protein LOC111700190 [Eurytemora carolleeae]|uniref:uncharacterized protein LOC111700190 n=1 Tax=Eurytemora carolleeae TaxID=1294199 RepID=UPI000C75B986|nr:uncharacterized protein LOC111700190 [Eurytemora carolleeae]|eukprot:XP_023326805.1 uncharacterized protein LOC111700190 [Eurytemora affinis]